VALTRKGMQGDLEITPNLIAQMYGCFACMACNELCPVGIKPADLALQMRHVQEQRDPAKWKQALFGGVVSHPERMEAVTFPLRVYQSLGLRKLYYKFGLRKIMPKQLRDLEGMLPHLPVRPLRQKLAQTTSARGESRYRVGFFLGCAQSLMFAEESAASVRVMSRNGCTVVTPREVVCCGMPAHGYGRMDLVRDAAKHNIAVFEKYDVETIVTDCATCGSSLKEYAQTLADDPAWAERAQKFSSRVRDISEFLDEIPLEKPAGRVEARVTYHDPCHLRRGQKVWKQPRKLLSMIDGVEFVEMPEADWCCGSAGSQLITHYETSTKVMERKISNLENTQADVIASGCPGCQMQLISGVKRRGLDVRVVHPVTLLDEAYEASNDK